MKKKYISLIFVLIFFSCANRSEKKTRYSDKQIACLELDSTKILEVETNSATKVDLDAFVEKKTFDFGSMVEELMVVPLETSSESLLDAIYQIIITDANIYILDKFKGGGIVIFNNDGKFIKRIPNGKGPGELMRLYDFDFDKDNNELVAYQHSFLLHFTSNGQFKKQERLPFGFYNFAVIPEGYVFKTIDAEQGNEHMGTLKSYMLMITDKNFKLKSVGLPCKSRFAGFIGYNYLHNNSSLYVTHQYNDTIYQYDSSTNQLQVKLILDYRKKKLPEKFAFGTWEQFEKAVRQNDYYFYNGDFIDTEDFSAITLENQYSGQTIIYQDKKSGNLIGGTNANYNLNEIPPIAFPRWTSGDYFISLYYPNGNEPFITKSSIISDEDKLEIKELTKNDNPVLVFFKLKSF